MERKVCRIETVEDKLEWLMEVKHLLEAAEDVELGFLRRLGAEAGLYEELGVAGRVAAETLVWLSAVGGVRHGPNGRFRGLGNGLQQVVQLVVVFSASV